MHPSNTHPPSPPEPLIAGYIFVAWTPWTIGLALVLLPALGVPHMLHLA